MLKAGIAQKKQLQSPRQKKTQPSFAGTIQPLNALWSKLKKKTLEAECHREAECRE
jgi:hypothetical protein